MAVCMEIDEVFIKSRNDIVLHFIDLKYTTNKYLLVKNAFENHANKSIFMKLICIFCRKARKINFAYFKLLSSFC